MFYKRFILVVLTISWLTIYNLDLIFQTPISILSRKDGREMTQEEYIDVLANIYGVESEKDISVEYKSKIWELIKEKF